MTITNHENEALRPSDVIIEKVCIVLHKLYYYTFYIMCKFEMCSDVPLLSSICFREQALQCSQASGFPGKFDSQYEHRLDIVQYLTFGAVLKA